MRKSAPWFLLASLTALGLAIPRVVHSQITDPVGYRMAPGSQELVGCFGPCECVVIKSGPATGDFVLRLTSVDPLFNHYEISNVAWTYATGDTGTEFTAHASGRGTYDIGGEVALMQRMTLDLMIQVESAPPTFHHYDSGLVPVQTPFPDMAIDVRIKIDACRDSVFRVIAKPSGTASVTPWPGSRLLRSAIPNPTSHDVEVLLAPRKAGQARVDVVDVGGRVVATLLDGAVGTGPYSLRWDGRVARGDAAGAGVFWIMARAGDQTDRVRIVRLR